MSKNNVTVVSGSVYGPTPVHTGDYSAAVSLSEGIPDEGTEMVYMTMTVHANSVTRSETPSRAHDEVTGAVWLTRAEFEHMVSAFLNGQGSDD